jgi:dienelactone hydrolase
MHAMKISRRFLQSSLLAACVALPMAGAATKPETPKPQEVQIRVKGTAAFPAPISMETQVFKPEGRGPFPVLIYSHGRAVDKDARAALEHPIPKGHVRYWLRKGFAVVAPIRPGYGETGGADRENNGARFASNGTCTHPPDFAKATESGINAVQAAIDWARQQGWADRDAILLEGQSVGGMTTVAAAARNPQGVIGYINFAGGGAGNPELAPGRSCRPDVMGEQFAKWGQTTKLPNIWLYATNDQFWGPKAPRQWHKGFAAGGSRSKFIQTEAVPGYDGHQLLLRGGNMWGVHLTRFLGELGYK